MAAVGVGPPAVAIPTPAPRSYHDYYSIAANDPMAGNYTDVFAIMQTEGATVYTADQLYQSIIATPLGFPNGLIGMYQATGYPGGLSLMLSGIRPNPTALGVASPWSDMTFGFVGDVIEGEIPTATMPLDPLALLNGGAYHIGPGSLARIDEVLANDPNAALIGPFTAAEPNAIQYRTRTMMYVPPKYIPIVVGRRLTPRQLWTDLVGAIRANNDEANCQPLINWVLLSLLASDNTANATSVLAKPMPALPLPDVELVRYRREVLQAQLPGLVYPISADANTAATHQLTNFVGQLIEEQRQARSDERDRAEETRAPKKPSSFWGEELCRNLCTLCGVATEAQLPPLWLALAAAGKSKDRIVLENHLLSVARTIGLRSAAPLATPDLTKKLVHLRFAGDNIDDLTEGLQPFVLTIQDHGAIGFSTSLDTQQVRQQNEEYDLLGSDNISTSLADARTIRTTSAAKIPQTYDHMLVMFQAYQVVLHATLGDNHPVVQAYDSFVRAYSDELLYYQGRLKALACTNAPGRLMRFIQLRMINWFRETRSTGSLPPPPDFRTALQCMDRSETSWIPDLPLAYKVPPVPPAAPTPSYAGSVVPGTGTIPPSVAGTDSTSTISQITNATKAPTSNPHRNPVFQPYHQQVQNIKLATLVKDKGAPPKNTAGIPMCLSYHLRGSCWSNCRRSKDHCTHTMDEDASLVQWCTTAFGSA